MTDPDETPTLIVLLRDGRGAIDAMDEADREPRTTEIERLGKVLGYAESVIVDTDMDLVTADSLAEVEQALTTVRDTPAAALDGHHAATALLNALSGFPAFHGQQTKEAISEVAGTFQRSSSQRLNALQSEFDERDAAIRASFEEIKTKVTELGSQIETQGAESEHQLAQLQTAVTNTKQSVEQMLAEEQQRFRTEQNERDTEFKAQRDEAEAQLKKLREAQEEAGREHLARLAGHEEHSAELVGKVATNTTAGHFLTEADKEARHAFWWRMVTFALGLGAVIATALAAVADNPSVAHVVAKLGVAAAFGAVATFTGRQSGNHRQREKNLRDLQLQLSAFEPIISRLGEKAGERETVVLIRKLFGQPYGEAPSEEDLPPELQLGDQEAA
jgi:hypothetical protein